MNGGSTPITPMILNPDRLRLLSATAAGLEISGFANGTAGSTYGEITLGNRGTSQYGDLRYESSILTLENKFTGSLNLNIAGVSTFSLLGSGQKVANNMYVGFSGTAAATGAVDTALYRNAAGTVEVNNGTAGTFRDLILRNVRTNPTTVGALPAAATAGAGARGFVTDATACTLNGALTGGGAVACPVHSDGSAWLGG